MKIDRKLNLIVPIDHDDGKTYYVHSTPISREVFEQNFVLLGKTFNATYAQGLGIAGPRLVALTMKRVATEMGQWDAVQAGLIADIHRRSTVLVPNEVGSMEVVPWTEAVAKKLFSEDDAREVDNALCFFTLASAMHKKAEMDEVEFALKIGWGAEMSSSTPMAYAASLKTSTTEDSTGENGQETEKRSSIPY